MLEQNHYHTLQIPMSATAQEVKKAYRSLARKHHPDKHNNDPKATEYFQQIQAAYHTLSDASKRAAYDKTLIKDTQYNPFAQQQHLHASSICADTEKLLRYLLTQSQRGINHDALADYILGMLNPQQQALLLRENDTDTNRQIAKNLLQAANSIMAPRLYDQIAEAIQHIVPTDTDIAQRIAQQQALRRAKERENKIVPIASIFIIVIVIAIMMLLLLT